MAGDILYTLPQRTKWRTAPGFFPLVTHTHTQHRMETQLRNPSRATDNNQTAELDDEDRRWTMDFFFQCCRTIDSPGVEKKEGEMAVRVFFGWG